jgi:hypothetical protein
MMPKFGQNYLAIMVDIGEPLKRPDTNMIDLVFNLGRAIFVAGETVYPGRMDRQLYTDLHYSVGEQTQKWVSRQAATIKVPELIKTGFVLLAGIAGGPGAAKVVDAAGEQAIKAFQLTPEEMDEIQKVVKQPPRLEDVTRSVSAIVQHLENEVARRETLLLVDGLDRLAPNAALDIFRDGRHLAGLPCRAAIVAPFEVYYALGYPARQDFPVLHFPNVYVSEERHHGADPEPGLAFFRELFAKRLPEGLQTTAIAEPPVINRLARSSGGIVRDFVKLVQFACLFVMRSKLPRLTGEAAQAAEERLQEEYRAKLDKKIIETLRQVHQAKARIESPLVPELIYETLMLSYSHRGHVWWEAHPALGAL